MTEQEMVDGLVSAAEKGFPGDREKQIQQVSARALQMPVAYTGVFLQALKILSDRRGAEIER